MTKSFEELAASKWKFMLIGEDRDYHMLVAFAKRKYNSDENHRIDSKELPQTKSSFIAGIRT